MYTYEEIEFRIPVREGFYHYQQKVSPAYPRDRHRYQLGHPSLSIAKPGKSDDRWYVSEFATGERNRHPQIHIPRSKPSSKRLQD